MTASSISWLVLFPTRKFSHNLDRMDAFLSCTASVIMRFLVCCAALIARFHTSSFYQNIIEDKQTACGLSLKRLLDQSKYLDIHSMRTDSAMNFLQGIFA